MCGCIYSVSYSLARSRTVSHGLSQSCTIAIMIIHGHGTSVSFLKVFKSYTAFRDPLEWTKCNSDKATVGLVVCTANRISCVFCVRQALVRNAHLPSYSMNGSSY